MSSGLWNFKIFSTCLCWMNLSNKSLKLIKLSYIIFCWWVGIATWVAINFIPCQVIILDAFFSSAFFEILKLFYIFQWIAHWIHIERWNPIWRKGRKFRSLCAKYLDTSRFDLYHGRATCVGEISRLQDKFGSDYELRNMNYDKFLLRKL